MKYYLAKGDKNCGPASFINLVGLNGTRKLEQSLSEIGRIKPFYISLYPSFLIWAEKYKLELLVYNNSNKINDKMFDLMFYYEKIPHKLKEKYKKQAKSFLDKLNKKFSSRIFYLKNPVKELDRNLEKNRLIAILISDFYLRRRKPLPHWIVAFKKKKNKYYFKDPAKGITILTKREILEGIKINKRLGFNPQLIVY